MAWEFYDPGRCQRDRRPPRADRRAAGSAPAAAPAASPCSCPRGGRPSARARPRAGRSSTRCAPPGSDVSGAGGRPGPDRRRHEAWDPTQYDEVFVSTLPTGTSRWLQVDLPHRVERLTGVPVDARGRRSRAAAAQRRGRRAAERTGVLTPLARRSPRRAAGAAPARSRAGRGRLAAGRAAPPRARGARARRAESSAVDLRALQKKWRSGSQVKPMPPCTWIATR